MTSSGSGMNVFSKKMPPELDAIKYFPSGAKATEPISVFASDALASQRLGDVAKVAKLAASNKYTMQFEVAAEITSFSGW